MWPCVSTIFSLCIFGKFQPENGDYDFNPPDGGWGWVVCIASFWTNGTVFGILNTFGILYVEMLRKFDDGNDSSNLAFKICKCPTLYKHHYSRSIINSNTLRWRYGFHYLSYFSHDPVGLGWFPNEVTESYHNYIWGDGSVPPRLVWGAQAPVAQ